MFKPLLNDLLYKIKPVITSLNGGVNNGLSVFELPDNVAREMQNIDSRLPEALNVRPPRSNYTTALTAIKHIGARQDDYITAVDGTVWKYWNGSAWVNILTGLTAANDAKTVDFVGKTILVNGTDNKYWDGLTSGDVTGMPDANFLTVHANRIYAASRNTQQLNYSAFRLYNDWTTPDDAGNIVAETRDGEGASGLTTYANHVILFKEHSMHELYGTGPINYSFQTASDKIGCISDRTIKEVKGVLYWLGYEGVYSYSGGTAPKLISFPVQDYINRLNVSQKLTACAGTDGERYYISIPIDTWKILCVYDARLGKWYVEDAIQINEFLEFGNTLYGATATQIMKMMDPAGTESVSWYWISKPYNENSLSMQKSWHRLFFIVDLPIGSTLNVSLSADAEGSSFTNVSSIAASTSMQVSRVMIPLTVAQNAEWVRIKLSGTGPCTIHQMERQLRIKKTSY
jgi:hypothetical protein